MSITAIQAILSTTPAALPPIWQLFLGVMLGILVAYLAWRAHTLSSSGAVAAALEGAIIFGLGGLAWAVLLLAFFISSSGLSRAYKSKKRRMEEKFSKGSQRDAGQVLANGGVASLFALIHFLLLLISPSTANATQVWAWAAFAGSLAAANADTWATELGVLSKATPRLITSWNPIETGTSGGVSLFGTLAAFSGALLLGILAFALSPQPEWTVMVAVTLGGLAGSMVDSLLGATIQAIYWCPACEKETERFPKHLCGTPTTLRRGLPWMNNDWVNAVCTPSGALIAMLLAIGLG